MDFGIIPIIYNWLKPTLSSQPGSCTIKHGPLNRTSAGRSAGTSADGTNPFERCEELNKWSTSVGLPPAKSQQINIINKNCQRIRSTFLLQPDEDIRKHLERILLDHSGKPRTTLSHEQINKLNSGSRQITLLLDMKKVGEIFQITNVSVT